MSTELMEINDNTTPTSNELPDAMAMQVKNPRISKVRALEEESIKQRQAEEERAKRIQVELEYLNNVLQEVNDNLEYSREEKSVNAEFEHRIRTEVYQMHGISNDKVQGMEERSNALYQGAAFSLLFLSTVLVILCGVLHGFGSQICLFMAFYTALQASLLTTRRLRIPLIETITHIVYLLLFPIMLVLFVCFELGYSQYETILPICIVAGMAVLLLSVSSYFLYDPYKKDRKNVKKADRYIAEMEKTALKDVQLREAKFKKQEKKREREQAWENKKAENKAAWEKKKADGKSAIENKRAEIKAARDNKSAGDTPALEDNSTDNDTSLEDNSADNNTSLEDNSADNDTFPEDNSTDNNSSMES